MLPRKERRRHEKETARADKLRQRAKKNVFVLDFRGDIMASAVESLRHEVSALVSVAGAGDEVVLRLESPGGAAHQYGFAAAQLARLRQKGLRLTACVDRVAASGGYMMACVADEIVAAPFAILGSIGVVAPLPNLHRLLERHGIDYENATAGEHKRTVSMLAAPSEQGRQKFQEQIDDLHALFKEFVHEHRPGLTIDEVATGETFLGPRAVEKGLADKLMTSDDYLVSKLDEANLFEVFFVRSRGMRERLTESVAAMLERGAELFWSRVGRAPLG
jgi:serine protease SohB